MRPRTAPHLLNPAEAVLSRNTSLSRGSLVPLRGTTVLQALNRVDAQTIFRYGNSGTEGNWWFEFDADVDVIESPVPNDAWGRAYWTDGAHPKYGPNNLLISGSSGYPGGSYNLGVPQPLSVPTTTFTPGSGPTAETRAYVYTYVSFYGEEGPPSEPTALITVDPTASVTLAGMATGPGGPYNLTLKRIYRTSTTDAGAEFQFVAEIPIANTSYVDTVAQAALGEVLPTIGWDPPPQGLRGLKVLANGACIGFVGNTVHLSEPNLPHAWPHKVAIDEQIVSIGVFRQGAAILTSSYPFILTGADPQAMTPERIETPLPCVSKRSVVSAGDGTLYASTEGVVSISPGGGSVITGSLMTRDQWQAYNPSSMIGAFHNGKYHLAYTTSGGERGMLIFDMKEGGVEMTTCDVNAAAPISAMYTEASTDTLYFAQSGSIRRHDRGSALTMLRRSGTFRLAAPANMACISIWAEAYPVTVRAYGDGNLLRQVVATSRDAYRLPAGAEHRDFQIEIEGSSEVTQVIMATSIAELRAAQ